MARAVLAYTAQARGDLEGAVQLGGEALGRMRELRHMWGEASVLLGLGISALQRGAHREAQLLLEDSAALHRRLGDARGEAEALNTLAMVARECGDLAAAAALHEAALERFRSLGDAWQMAGVFADWGTLQAARGDGRGAAALHRQGLVLYRRVGDRRGVAACLESLAWVQTLPDRAARLLGAAEAVRKETGGMLPPLDERRHTEALVAARTRLGEAGFRQEWTRGLVWPYERAIAEALWAGEATESTAGAPLTPRQQEVATLVARGLANSEVAATLVLTVPSVKRHVHDALARLGLRSRTQLANWVNERDLGGVDPRREGPASTPRAV